jgi:hypothetical protein
MKSVEFKKIIKEAVREVIQEELKDILLEAVKTPKTVVRESYSSTTNPIQPSQPAFTPNVDLRSKYADILGETALSFTSNDVQPFRPQVSDPINGNLGVGEVDMNQIMGLLNNK